MSRPSLIALTALSVLSWGVTEGFAEEHRSAKQLIERFDTDGDGKLDRTELRAALELDDRDDEQEVSFVRVTRSADGTPLTLETAIASYHSANGDQTVDLIGAVHVGDKAYYEQLNRLFRDYDAVLYELIAPKGTRIPRGGQRSDHPVGRMQRGIKSLLDLSFQLDEVDYTAKHLVHADMSPKEFSSSMEERGESFLQILFRMMGQAASQAGRKNAPSDGDLLMALFAPDRSLRLKRILAAQFEDLEGQMNVFEGPAGSTLISERNKRALSVLRREQARGHDKVAIFYGAGHMSDMADRLEQEFSLHHDSTRWLKAWDMSGTARKNAHP